MANHKCAVVTGAGSGIGRSTARLLARAGYNVVLVGRTRAKLEETAASLRDGPPHESLVLSVELTDPAATRAIVDHALAAFGRIDAMANVAGAAPLLPIEKITPEIWRDCIDANLSYVVNLTAAAWPTFRKQKSGVIVNVSSMASIDPFPGFSIYAAAKVGINMFTKCTASEGKEIGVRAVTVAPGAVETPMLRGLFSETQLPRDKTLRPEEVAKVICGCITGDRKFESGEVIVVASP
jgi:NAD(P)-dependent dehydrogenase (short-subunit alcohol dehydrogenase family)